MVIVFFLCSDVYEAYWYCETCIICFPETEEASLLHSEKFLVLHTVTWHISYIIYVCFIQVVKIHIFILSYNKLPTFYSFASSTRWYVSCVHRMFTNNVLKNTQFPFLWHHREINPESLALHPLVGQPQIDSSPIINLDSFMVKGCVLQKYDLYRGKHRWICFLPDLQR
jgi:hypothetical protein